MSKKQNSQPATPEENEFTVTVGEAIEALLPLSILNAHELPAREAWAVSYLFAVLKGNPHVIAGSAAKDAALKAHGKDNGDGTFVLAADSAERFTAEYKPISERMLKLSAERLPMSILDHAPKMTGNQIGALRMFFAAAEI